MAGCSRPGTCLSLVGLLLLSLAAAHGEGRPSDSIPPIIEGTEGRWTARGNLRREYDPLLGRTVYEVAGNATLTLRPAKEYSWGFAAEALVRFPGTAQPGAASAALRCGVRGDNGVTLSSFSLQVTPNGAFGFRAKATAGPRALAGHPDGLDSEVAVAERFPADRFSPDWSAEFRHEVESGMARLPKGAELWRKLGIEVREESARFYCDGTLVAEFADPQPRLGPVVLELRGPVRLAELDVRSIDREEGRYVPVPLEGVCNAVGPVNPSSLPGSGGEAVVEGVPFVFVARNQRGDHLDVGASLFRYRRVEGRGYQLAARTWPSPTALDPARLMLRVPKRAYGRAWILAASDGEPYSTPVLTLRFFRVGKGWPLDSVARVPDFTATTSRADARRVAVRMTDGTPGWLWLLPLEIDSFWLASDFREEDVLHIELTKEVKDYRRYPIPENYGSYPAGLPSAARVYGLTLEKAPVAVIGSSDRAGNLHTDPETPTWLVDLASQSHQDITAAVSVEVTDPYGKRTSYGQRVLIPAGRRQTVRFDSVLHKYGLHKVRTSVLCHGHVQSREGTLLWLPPDRRKANGRTTRWGLWNWAGGHGTNPNAEDNLRISYALGARTGSGFPYKDRKKWGIGPRVHHLEPRREIPAFAVQDPVDPVEYARFSDDFGRRVAALREQVPDLEYVTTLAEPKVSERVSYGVPPYAFGLPWFDYTDEERQRIRGYLTTFRAAFEGVRKHAPGVKFLLGWGEPQFPLAFFRERFPKGLFDGFGIQSRLFETMPERAVPRRKEFSLLYFLKPEMQQWGYEGKQIVHTESYFPPSDRLALGQRGQADHVVRSAVLSLALGTDRFLWAWSLHDCEDYWGSQHYGCVGMIGRRPEYNPKLAASAFATMTQLLDSADFDGHLPTGSRSAYCLRFRRPDALVYCLWTLRGTRPITLRASAGSRLTMVDESGNETPLALSERRATLVLSQTPIWVVAKGGKVTAAAVGSPTYAESPGPDRILLDDFEKPRWTRREGEYDFYAKNNWDVVRTPGPIQVQYVYSPERKSRALRVRLAKAPTGKAPFVGWYCVYEPTEPAIIPGKARALGVYANGNSGWGRIIYELVDAKGELFLNCGAKDSWFSGDMHSWSHFNFDGWHYMEFPLPGSSPGDDYAEKDCVWWQHSQEGIVDLPLRLNKVIFEMQTCQIYVNEILPCRDQCVELDDLMAVYDDAEMMTDAPVRLQRGAAGAVAP